jgi:hypothetical protein
MSIPGYSDGQLLQGTYVRRMSYVAGEMAILTGNQGLLVFSQ